MPMKNCKIVTAEGTTIATATKSRYAVAKVKDYNRNTGTTTVRTHAEIVYRTDDRRKAEAKAFKSGRNHFVVVDTEAGVVV